jgi:hypothetical protein
VLAADFVFEPIPTLRGRRADPGCAVARLSAVSKDFPKSAESI